MAHFDIHEARKRTRDVCPHDKVRDRGTRTLAAQFACKACNASFSEVPIESLLKQALNRIAELEG